jgi:hypothetical protein
MHRRNLRHWRPPEPAKFAVEDRGVTPASRTQTNARTMKPINKLALVFAGLFVAGASFGQTTANTAPMTGASIRDNPGILGHSFTDVNYSWVDFSRDQGVDADGYIAGITGNLPIARGFDLGLGYNYFRENGHRNPFTGTDYDARYHQLNTSGALYAPMAGMKPFVAAGLGYQWSRGDFQRLRTFDEMWLWNAGAGVEIPLGMFSLTPRVTYSDAFDDNGVGIWRYGGQVHHWFNERMGGYLDATFHESRGNFRANAWTYTAGLRLKF